MFLIGLTGGIAAGKSTVAEHWASLGAIEIDADQLARQVVEPGTLGLLKVTAAFGPGFVNEDGALDRKALGSLVFDQPELRQKLESILHPLIQAETRARLAEQPADAIVVYNVPLLVEAGVDLPFDRVVTVEAPIDDQVKRLTQNRGMEPGEALARIKSQATPAQRANRADFILNSNQDIGLLLKDAGKLWLQFEREAQAKLAASHSAPSRPITESGSN
jgi:dephospho-CoA kinase